MNEVQLLRRQMSIERQHARELAALCAAVPAGQAVESRPTEHRDPGAASLNQAVRPNEIDSSTTSYSTYIMYSLDRERTRAAAHMARLGRDAELTGAERAALARLEEALDAARATAAPCATLLADLIEAAARLEALVERRYTIEDWREVARVDADSILEERRLWAETQLHGPLAPTR